MQSSTVLGSMHRVWGIVPVQQLWSEAGICGVHNLIGVTAVTNRADFTLDCSATVFQARFGALFLCNTYGQKPMSNNMLLVSMHWDGSQVLCCQAMQPDQIVVIKVHTS